MLINFEFYQFAFDHLTLSQSQLYEACLEVFQGLI
jgi:hypothetical protein